MEETPEQLKTTFALYNQDTVHKNELESYTRMKNMVKKYLDQRQRIETSMPEMTASVKLQLEEKEMTEVKSEDGTQGDCNQWLVKRQ